MLGYSQIISARAFKEPRVRRKTSMIQHLVRQQTHSLWITCTLPCTKDVSLRKYVIFFRSPELFCHHNFNLTHVWLQRIPYLSETEFDFFHMVQMKNFHKRKSRLEVQRNNLRKQSICESNIHPLHYLSSVSLQSISWKAETKAIFEALLLLIPQTIFSIQAFIIYRPSSNNIGCA